MKIEAAQLPYFNWARVSVCGMRSRIVIERDMVKNLLVEAIEHPAEGASRKTNQ